MALVPTRRNLGCEHNKYVMFIGLLLCCYSYKQAVHALPKTNLSLRRYRMLSQGNEYWQDYNHNFGEYDGQSTEIRLQSEGISTGYDEQQQANDENNAENEGSAAVVMDTTRPTLAPTTEIPTRSPTQQPTNSPTHSPTFFPSHQPTINPTKYPSFTPTLSPTAYPSHNPTLRPTSSPSQTPTLNPTQHPSALPTMIPTSSPSYQPSGLPTASPSQRPSTHPTHSPSLSPSSMPSHKPTNAPSKSPSHSPSSVPTMSPSFTPSSPPSVSMIPSANPTSIPSSAPSLFPSSSPTITSETVDLNPFELQFHLEIPGSTTRTNFELNEQEEKILCQYIESYLVEWYDSKLKLFEKHAKSVVTLDTSFVRTKSRGLSSSVASATGTERQRRESEFELLSVVIEMSWNFQVSGSVTFQHFPRHIWIPPNTGRLGSLTESAFDESESLHFVHGLSEISSSNQNGAETVLPFITKVQLNNNDNLNLEQSTKNTVKTLEKDHVVVVASVWLVAAAISMVMCSLYCWARMRATQKTDPDYPGWIREKMSAKRDNESQPREKEEHSKPSSDHPTAPENESRRDISSSGTEASQQFDVDTSTLASSRQLDTDYSSDGAYAWSNVGFSSTIGPGSNAGASSTIGAPSTIGATSTVVGAEHCLKWSERFSDVWSEESDKSGSGS